MKSKHLAKEAVAKRDVAGRLKTLAAGTPLSSDRTWLMRRARELERGAANLEQQIVALAKRHAVNRSRDGVERMKYR